MPRYGGLRTVHDIQAPHEYWERPEIAQQGDSNDTVLFISVGIALSEWENLEQNMAELFGWFVESQSFAASRAYGFSVAGKFEFIKGASEVFFKKNNVSGEHQREFDILLQHKQRAGGFRNEIAHGRVIGLGVNGQDFGKFLLSPGYNSRKTDLPFSNVSSSNPLSIFPSKYRYTSSQIKEITDKIICIRDICSEYLYLLANNYSHDAWSVQKQTPPPLPPNAPTGD